MPMTRAAKPATKPGAATHVTSRAKKPAAKTAAAKTSKKTAAKKPAKPKISKKAFKEKSKRIRASADARRATMDTTAVRTEPDSSASGTAAKPKPAPRPPRRSAVERLEDSPPAAGAVLIERVVSAIERELTQVDAIVGKRASKAQRTEAERRARTLASLARTLTEVRKLRADEDKSKAKDDDTGPEDIEAFRLELAQKLDRLAAEAQALFPGETNSEGDA
jgi:hypothetical protein